MLRLRAGDSIDRVLSTAGDGGVENGRIGVAEGRVRVAGEYASRSVLKREQEAPAEAPDVVLAVGIPTVFTSTRGA